MSLDTGAEQEARSLSARNIARTAADRQAARSPPRPQLPLPLTNTTLASPVQAYLTSVHEHCLEDTSGAVADYIPELARVDADAFGLCLATIDGHVYEVGDTSERFTIQSMSKPFTYGLALEDAGYDRVMAKVGLEPSGEAFNSISLEPDTGRPMNPMINAGAITTTSLVAGADAAEREARLLAAYGRYAGRELDIDTAVYISERDTGHRNRAIGNMLRSFGILEDDPDLPLDLYFRQCSIAVDCRDLSVMAATLANGGVNPITGERALTEDYVDTVLSVMTTCGMYDAAGNWVEGVGMPAKSGVSGGIIAVLPGQLGIGVYSPRLDAVGNSVRGVRVCELLAQQQEMHFLRVARSSRSAIRARHDVASVPSKRLRGEGDRAVLEEHGTRAIVFELQGDLVFGAVEAVVHQVAARCEDLDLAVIDLRATTEMHHAAAGMLLELRRFLLARGRELVFVSALGEPALEAAAGVDPPRIFQDLDSATDWCEETLLGRYGTPQEQAGPIRLADHQIARGLSKYELERLESIVSTRVFDAGETIIRVGDPADEIYLLVRGEVSVTVEGADGLPRRLSTLLPGIMFGELAVIGQSARTANVIADRAGELLVIGVEDLQILAATDPTLHAGILQNMLATAYDTITRLTREVASLTDRG